VAAQAAGVPRATFRAWLARGEKPRAREPFRAFAAEVRAAQAHARVLAEMAVVKKNPVAWLKHGPGRETSETPGWTVTVRPQAGHEPRALDVRHHPELAELFGVLLRALEPFPEARAAVAQVLAGAASGPTSGPG
jgi:hypothetical protein